MDDKNKSSKFLNTENGIVITALVTLALMYRWLGFEVTVIAALAVIIGRLFFTTKAE
ncbi:MAG: hypothetical protein GY864_10840 [Desulfobacterales bacterium]|nr:hypothetical protein [Desulfobacterales bacterium]